MGRIAIACALLCCGCSVTDWRYTQELGYVSSDLGTTTLFEDTGQRTINAMQLSSRIEAEVWRNKHFAVDLGAGPTVVLPTSDHDGQAFGGEIAGRFIWKAGAVEPYVSISQGMLYHEQAWEPTDVQYGFPTQFGVGVRKRVDDNFTIGCEYRWWHNSWGESKLGSDFRDTLNLSNRGANPGFEGGAVIVSFSFHF